MMPLAIESHSQFVVYVSTEFCQNLFDLDASLAGVLLHCLEIYAVFGVVMISCRNIPAT